MSKFMASLAVNIRIEREGLLLRLYSENGRLITKVDLKEELKLSDEQAASLLQKLEESKTCQ